MGEFINANIKKEQIAMEKKYIKGQPLAKNPSSVEAKQSLLHYALEKILTTFGLMMFLSIPLFIIGRILKADQPFELFLCLPFAFSVVPVCLHFPFSDLAKDVAKKTGYVKVLKITFCSLFCYRAFRFPVFACTNCH